jgi:hypothetical protein
MTTLEEIKQNLTILNEKEKLLLKQKINTEQELFKTKYEYYENYKESGFGLKNIYAYDELSSEYVEYSKFNYLNDDETTRDRLFNDLETFYYIRAIYSHDELVENFIGNVLLEDKEIEYFNLFKTSLFDPKIDYSFSNHCLLNEFYIKQVFIMYLCNLDLNDSLSKDKKIGLDLSLYVDKVNEDKLLKLLEVSYNDLDEYLIDDEIDKRYTTDLIDKEKVVYLKTLEVLNQHVRELDYNYYELFVDRKKLEEYKTYMIDLEQKIKAL